MTDPRQEELVSALLDGELDGSEQAASEQLLDQDPQARALFDQFSQLSETLRSLPQLKAPAELLPAVMAGLTPAAPAPSRPRVSRSWLWTASAAASLMLAFVVYRVVDQSLSTGIESTVGDLAMAPMEASAVRSDAMADEGSGAAQMDALVAAQAAQPATEPVPFETAELSELFLEGNIPEPGELIDRLVQQDGELQLVQYTVVDVARAFDEVQVLLRQQRIRSITPEEPAITVANAEGGLVGIFVEASETQLAEVIESLSGDADFVVEVSTYAQIAEADMVRDEPGESETIRSVPPGRAALPADRPPPPLASTEPERPAEDFDAESAESGVAYASSLPVEDVDSLKQGSRSRVRAQAQMRTADNREARRRVLIVLHPDSR